MNTIFYITVQILVIIYKVTAGSSGITNSTTLDDYPQELTADVTLPSGRIIYSPTPWEDDIFDITVDHEINVTEHRRLRRRTKIKMPSGKYFYIPSPKPNQGRWQCSKSTVFVTLRKRRKEYIIIKKEMDNSIVRHPGYDFTRYNIKKIQKVINGCLWKQYLHRAGDIMRENQRVNQRMLFHGSSVSKDIANNGFNEQFSNIKGMFGAGLYFAEHSSKANQYVFSSAYAGGCKRHRDLNCQICERQMLLCRVALGQTKAEDSPVNYAHAPKGFHSVTGVNGTSLKYPEYIVYRREQVYPEYLITYTVE